MSRLTQLFSATPVIKTISTNDTLTTNDVGVEVSLLLSADSNITLPDAQTLAVGIDTFILRNDTNYRVTIEDYTGQRLVNIGACGSATLHLTNNTSPAGGWVCSNRKKLNNTASNVVGSATQLPNTAGGCTICKVIHYDASTVVTFYTNESSVFSAVAGTISGDTITYGTPITVFNGNIIAGVNATVVSGAIVFGYYNSSSAKVVLSTLTISGTSLTKGSDVVPSFTIANSGASGYWDLCTIDAANGKGLIQYVTGSYANTLVAVFTHNAGNITFGTAATLIDTTTTYSWPGGCRLVAYSGTIAYAAVKFSSSSSNYFVRVYSLVISGTSITPANVIDYNPSQSFSGSRAGLAVHVPTKKLAFYSQTGYNSFDRLVLYTVNETTGALTTASQQYTSSGETPNGTNLSYHKIYFANEGQLITTLSVYTTTWLPFMKVYDNNSNTGITTRNVTFSNVPSTFIQDTTITHLGNGTFWGAMTSNGLGRVVIKLPTFRAA